MAQTPPTGTHVDPPARPQHHRLTLLPATFGAPDRRVRDPVRHVGGLVDGDDLAAAGGNRVGGEPLESGERGPEVGQAELLAQLGRAGLVGEDRRHGLAPIPVDVQVQARAPRNPSSSTRPARLSIMPTSPAKVVSRRISRIASVVRPASVARSMVASRTLPRPATMSPARSCTAAWVGSDGDFPSRMAVMSGSSTPSPASTVEWNATP